MLDRKNIFRSSGVVPLLALLAIGALYFYSTYETLAKAWLEEKATLAYGAQIDIQDLKIELFRGKAHLTGVQITNPAFPLQNLFEIKNVSLSFSLKELLKKKMVISSIQVSDISSGTHRSSSGVINDLVDESQEHPVLWEKTDTGMFSELRNQAKEGPLKYLSQITTGAYTLTKMPNLKRSLSSLKYLEDLNQALEKSQREWKNQVTLLPAMTQVAQWQADIQQWDKRPRELASSHEQERRKNLAVTVREAYDSISNQLASAQKELQTFKSKMDSLANLLGDDIENLKSELNLPTRTAQDLSFSLFGLHFVSFLEKLSYWSDAYRHHGKVLFSTPKLEIVRTQHSKQTEYHFLNKKTPASIQIDQLLISQSNTSENSRTFSGTMQDFTLFPSFYGKNCKASFTGSIAGLPWEGINIQISLGEHEGASREEFDITINNLPLDDFIIRRTPDFEIKLSSGSAKLEAHGYFSGETIKVRGGLETVGTKFAVKSQFSPFEEMLQKLTQYQTTLSVSGQISKDNKKYSFDIESDFGKRLAENISENFSQQLAQIDDTLKTHILDSLFPVRQVFNEKVQDVENIYFAQMRTTLSELENMLSYTQKYDPQAYKFKDRYSKATQNLQNL